MDISNPNVPMIGGTQDGKMYKGKPGNSGDVLIIPAGSLSEESDANSRRRYASERYYLHAIKGRNCMFSVWVHESLDLDNAISRLIDFYAKQNSGAGD